MTGEQWAKVRLLLDRALDQPALRPALLDELRVGDPEACAELERLISDLDGEEETGGEPDPEGPSPAGLNLGPYHAIREIGRGGAGTVFLAEREEAGLRVSFAVKLLRPDFLRGAPRRFFQRELRALARLDHPNIARLADWGSVPGGLFYLALEYVDGRSITRYCADMRLGCAARLALFLQVCDAVEHAHRSLVVHRDLKPSNILVAARTGTVKLVDFGIASELDAAAEATTILNRALTPAYASPEQVEGKPVSVATDVYSLGLVLYELLAGQLPHGGGADRFPARLHGDPEPPSHRAMLPEVPSREIAGDLDCIVRKAIQKEPELRYRSVEQLAADLRRYLKGRPVQAHRPSRLYVTGRFLKRHRVEVAAIAAAAMALAVTAGVAIWKWRDAAHNLAEAQRDYRILRNFAEAVISNVDPKTIGSPTEAQRRMSETVARYLDQLSQGRQDDEQLQLQIAAAYTYLGDAQGGPNIRNQGEPQAALVNFEKACRIALRQWRATASRNSGIQLLTSSASVAQASGDPGSAVAALSSGLDLVQNLLARYPKDVRVLIWFANAYGTRGQQRRTAGDLAGALADFRMASDLAERAREIEPQNLTALGIWETHTSESGTTLRVMGRLQEALDAQSEARAVALRVVALAQSNRARRQAAFKLLSRGETLRRLGRYDEAERGVRAAKGELESIAGQDSADEQAKADLSLAYVRMGDLASTQGRWRDALRNYDEAFRLRQRQYAAHPTSARALRNYQNILVKYAKAELARGSAAPEARAHFDEAIDLGKRIRQTSPSDVYAAADLARAYDGAGECARRSGRLAEARQLMLQGAELWQDVRKRCPLDVELTADAAAGEQEPATLPAGRWTDPVPPPAGPVPNMPAQPRPGTAGPSPRK